ncbi:hypothetical protein M4D79_16355 [Mycolicibacterium novocastrense]|nr:hypothetical protein M4D79_16355 [Mycolicibacterium novocastrense]
MQIVNTEIVEEAVQIAVVEGRRVLDGYGARLGERGALARKVASLELTVRRDEIIFVIAGLQRDPSVGVEFDDDETRRLVSDVVRPPGLCELKPFAANRQHTSVEVVVVSEHSLQGGPEPARVCDGILAQSPAIDVDKLLGEIGDGGIDISALARMEDSTAHLAGVICQRQPTRGRPDPVFGVGKGGVFVIEVENARPREALIINTGDSDETPNVHFAVTTDCFTFQAADDDTR